MYEFPLALVFAGVPLPGRENPYIILVSPNPLVYIDVDIDEAEVSSASVRGLQLGWRYELAVKSFVDTLSARLEQPLKVVVEVESPLSYPPAASVYAATSLAVVKAVAEAAGYELDQREVLESASSVDEEAGVLLDYLDGLREALTTGRSLVYRRGEEPLGLSTGARLELELVGEEDIGEEAKEVLEDPIGSAVTRLSGLAVVEAAKRLREGDTDVFRLVQRVDNAVFYLLYGAETPRAECKWTPSLQRVYGVCRPGAGVGDPVEFVL
ncbi:hypothetical protein CF15_00710 [Pyrodictium occultum]|uniref:Pantoate kinase n=1 Tax=Pyrodictium occultum TaxID=2309 RepID=A0A0V8RTK6_PYROC|nr:hypothetical protein [Pyrodictium occultum]KSW11413.1 hypothetical protein CF15_00710 [Pyrodictium occultum]